MCQGNHKQLYLAVNRRNVTPATLARLHAGALQKLAYTIDPVLCPRARDLSHVASGSREPMLEISRTGRNGKEDVGLRTSN